ncbi:MAG: PQQ-dependent sugar dehydrogenase [Microcoleaceae cyanobacterium]
MPSLPITNNPIPTPIALSNLSVQLEEIAQIPNSGSGSSPAARLNQITDAPDGSDRLFVNDMRGKLYVIDNGTISSYLNLKSQVGSGFLSNTNQQGFSYFTFHPDFANNGIFYTINSESKTTGTPDFPVTKPIFDRNGNIIASSHHEVVREWTATNPSANLFAGTVREIMRVEQPYGDHNMGELAFNPNAEPGDADYGMLYLAVADGGSDGFPVSNTDPLDNGQDLNVPLGKILRIDPLGNNSASGEYGIPADNPFATDGDPNTLGEVWAYGLRNSHRFSWDTGGEGKMLIVDVGQAFIEEVNLGVPGANYGWGEREGTFVIEENNENALFELPPNDADFGYTYPVAQYDHDLPPETSGFFGFAIAGGFVYRGTAIPQLRGQYVFADFANDGRFFHVPVNELVEGSQATLRELRLYDGNLQGSFLDFLGFPRSDVRFGVDAAGEIYVTSKQDGTVRKLVPTPETDNNDTLQGNTDHNLMRGLAGNDSIRGGDGNDTLQGQAGNDTLSGENHNDTVYGQDGNDRLSGNAGNDRLDGGTGNDFLWGGTGNDTVNGNDGNDRVLGDTGNDQLAGGNGADTLTGTNSAAAGVGEQDILQGQGNADLFVLGDATKVYYLGAGTADVARISDFTVSTDKIQLHQGEPYQLQTVSNNTQIRLNTDLIGVITGVIGLNLNDARTFSYV